MPTVKICIPPGVEIETIIDNVIPTDWIIIPSEEGWHVIRGKEYTFVKWDMIHKIWQDAAGEWFWTDTRIGSAVYVSNSAQKVSE